ncbi:MAG: SpoIIIAH-like family protein [Ruminococcaceae bacterium]|nr:SpoIIIAH-like family protein [Oscillospiraceae bacterium]
MKAMKQYFKKKQWMTLSLVAAMGVAVYLNYALSGDASLAANGENAGYSDGGEGEHLGDATFVGAQPSDPAEKPLGYFDQARENRAVAREEALGLIQDVLNNAQAPAEEKQQATQKATAIAENVLQESNIESLLMAKGFLDSVVYIDGERCSVVVQAEALQQQESLQIMEIVVSQSSVSPDQVQIMAAEK